MALTGLVSEVVTEGVSAAVSGAVTAGAATITVDNAAQFPAAGSITVEDISTGTPVAEDLDYVIDDVDQPNLLNLVGVSTYGYTDGSIVTLTVPYIPTTTVYVTTDDNQPALPAIATQETVAVHAVALAEGPRDPGTGAPVELTESGGTYRVNRVLAEPTVSGPTIVGPVPFESMTDGNPPTDAPVITVSPFAIGAVRADWPYIDPAVNPDPVTYLVHASLTSPVLEDGSKLVGKTTGTNFQISHADGAIIPIDVSENPTQATVYVKVQSSDADGLGPFSAEHSATVLASDATVTARWVKALEIEAQQITSGTITANLGVLAALLVGGYVVIDGVTSNITIYADTLHTIPLVQLRPDGSVFRGQIIATDVSVLNGILIQGIQSQISQAAALTLMTGVGDPQTAPTLGNVTKQGTWPAQRSGYTEQGICWDATDGCWIRLLVPPVGSVEGATKVEKITAAGAHISDRTLANVSGLSEDDFNGLTRVGSNYVSVLFYDHSGHQDFYLARWAVSSGNYVDKVFIGTSVGTSVSRWATVGYDGTSILFAMSDGAGSGVSTTTVYLLDPTTLAITAAYDTPPIMGTWVHYVGIGSFDFGATRMVVGTGGTERVFTMTPATYPTHGTLTEVPAKNWIASSIGGTLSSGGLGWDGSAFWASEALLGTFTKFSKYYPAASEMAWVSYYDTATGPTRATLDSPVASIAVSVRSWLQIALPPSGGSSSGVLMGLATSLPADTALLQRAEALMSDSMLVDPSVAGGSVHPTLRTITNKALTSGVATLTTSAAHGYAVGNEVLVSGVDATFNGTYTITAVPTTTTFSYTKAVADVSSVAASGLAEANTFGAGTPGVIQSQDGGLVMRGDGTGKWPLRDDRVPRTLTDVTTTTETVCAKWTIPANFFKTAGDLAFISLIGQITGTAQITFRVKVGPLGDGTDPTMKTFTATGSSTANGYWDLEAKVFATAVGGSGLVAALGMVVSAQSTAAVYAPASGAFSPGSVDTTIANFITVTAELSAGSQTLSPKGGTLTKARG